MLHGPFAGDSYRGGGGKDKLWELMNTVTISLDDYHGLVSKAKGIDEIQANPDAYIIFQINEYWCYGLSKRYSGVDHGLLNQLRIANEELQKEIYELKSDKRDLQNENVKLMERLRPWYKFW